ncbi:unnamed protein product [Victoria cruziana]
MIDCRGGARKASAWNGIKSAPPRFPLLRQAPPTRFLRSGNQKQQKSAAAQGGRRGRIAMESRPAVAGSGANAIIPTAPGRLIPKRGQIKMILGSSDGDRFQMMIVKNQATSQNNQMIGKKALPPMKEDNGIPILDKTRMTAIRKHIHGVGVCHIPTSRLRKGFNDMANGWKENF